MAFVTVFVLNKLIFCMLEEIYDSLERTVMVDQQPSNEQLKLHKQLS